MMQMIRGGYKDHMLAVYDTQEIIPMLQGPSGRPKFWKSPESLQIVLPAEDKGSNCEAVAGKGDGAFDIQMTVDKASGSCFCIREQSILWAKY